MSGEPPPSGPPGSPGDAPAPADLDARIHADAVRRGLITASQGTAALEEARAAGVPLLEVLLRRNLLGEEAARDLDEEAREEFIPGYRVLSKLGEGGMGVVYRALQKRLDRVVALKVVTPHLAADPTYLRRFEREAKAVARLNHPNIVAAYDCGESGGRAWLAMEFVEGVNGAEWVRENGPMPEERALAVARDAAAGLAHAHAAGILHRDVKPANILLAAPRPGETGPAASSGAKVTDLGLARVGGAGGASELTAAGAVLGTPGYMPPEQAFGEEIDLRADIYGLGATLYHLITGRRPFEAATPVGVIANQQTDLLRDPRDLVPGISAGTAALLQGMLAREPGARYPGWGELLADLDLVRSGGTPLHPAPPPDQASIAAPMGLLPAEGAPPGPDDTAGGTIISPPPESARASSPGAASPPPSAAPAPSTAPSPTPPADAPKPRPSRAVLVAVALVIAVAAAAVAFNAGRKGTPPKEPPVPAGPGASKAPSPPPAAAGSPFTAEEEAVFQEALLRGDDREAVEALLGSWRRFEGMAPEDRRKYADRVMGLEEALRRAGDLVENRLQELAREGEYGKALEGLRRVKEQLGGATPLRLEMALTRLERAEESGPGERRAFQAARQARAAGDAAGVLAALEGYEERYGFSWRMEAVGAMRRWAEGELPAAPQDPVPAVLLVPAGDPEPLWKGVGLGGWLPEAGSWGESDPARKGWFRGVEMPQQAHLLRGERRGGAALLRRGLGPLPEGSAGWRLEVQAVGEVAADGAASRVEVRFAPRSDGSSLVLGVDGAGAYLGRRDPSGALERIRALALEKPGTRHALAVANHGDVFTAEVDGKGIGAVAVPADLDGAGGIRLAVEDGAGYFSDLLLQPLRKP